MKEIEQTSFVLPGNFFGAWAGSSLHEVKQNGRLFYFLALHFRSPANVLHSLGYYNITPLTSVGGVCSWLCSRVPLT